MLPGTPSPAVCPFSIIGKCQANLTDLNKCRSPATESLKLSKRDVLIAHGWTRQSTDVQFQHGCSCLESHIMSSVSSQIRPIKTTSRWYILEKCTKSYEFHPENNDILETSSISLVISIWLRRWPDTSWPQDEEQRPWMRISKPEQHRGNGCL